MIVCKLFILFGLVSTVYGQKRSHKLRTFTEPNAIPWLIEQLKNGIVEIFSLRNEPDESGSVLYAKVELTEPVDKICDVQVKYLKHSTLFKPEVKNCTKTGEGSTINANSSRVYISEENIILDSILHTRAFAVVNGYVFSFQVQSQTMFTCVVEIKYEMSLNQFIVILNTCPENADYSDNDIAFWVSDRLRSPFNYLVSSNMHTKGSSNIYSLVIGLHDGYEYGVKVEYKTDTKALQFLSEDCHDSTDITKKKKKRKKYSSVPDAWKKTKRKESELNKSRICKLPARYQNSANAAKLLTRSVLAYPPVYEVAVWFAKKMSSTLDHVLSGTTNYLVVGMNYEISIKLSDGRECFASIMSKTVSQEYVMKNHNCNKQKDRNRVSNDYVPYVPYANPCPGSCGSTVVSILKIGSSEEEPRCPGGGSCPMQQPPVSPCGQSGHCPLQQPPVSPCGQSGHCPLQQHMPSFQQHMPSLQQHLPSFQQHMPSFPQPMRPPISSCGSNGHCSQQLPSFQQPMSPPIRPCGSSGHCPLQQQQMPSFQQHMPSLQQHIPSFQQHMPSLQQHIPSFQQHMPSFQQHMPSFQQPMPSFQQPMSPPIRPCGSSGHCPLQQQMPPSRPCGSSGHCPLQQQMPPPRPCGSTGSCPLQSGCQGNQNCPFANRSPSYPSNSLSSSYPGQSSLLGSHSPYPNRQSPHPNLPSSGQSQPKKPPRYPSSQTSNPSYAPNQPSYSSSGVNNPAPPGNSSSQSDYSPYQNNPRPYSYSKRRGQSDLGHKSKKRRRSGKKN